MADQACLQAALIYAVLHLLLHVVSCSSEVRAIYLVLAEGEPVAFLGGLNTLKANQVPAREAISKAHAKKLVDNHDQLLRSTLESRSYDKLYSFTHILNGFAVHTTPSQAKKLKYAPGVTLLEKDRGVRTMTTHTPQFLHLPEGIWAQQGGERNAGEGIVIGFIDTGINPYHPSFAYDPNNTFTWKVGRFMGACEAGPMFPRSACNGKIISARFFAAGAQAAATLNPSIDFLSPFDAVGHGSHVASTAAGNPDVPVVQNGFFYGRATGMAPRARIAVYKAIYPSIGTLADVVSAIDQALLPSNCIFHKYQQDSFVFEIALLFARRAGVFVVQAAGNQGPFPSTVISFSPWVVGVASCDTDRIYPGTLVLGNGQKIGGIGLSGPTFGEESFQYKLVLAKDAIKAIGTFPRTPEYIEECQYPEAFDPAIVQASIVICTFSSGFFNGTSSVTAIINTANVLGFMGFMLLANPTYGDFISEPIPLPIPGIMIPRVADSQQTVRYPSGLVTAFGGRAFIGEGRIASFTARAPVVSRFSSRGPDITDRYKNQTDVLKPDILAPGHQVWAAWSPTSVLDPILAGYNYALLSGTSMAAPHIAGIAAVIKQYNPTWTPSMIASAMATTATKYDNQREPMMAAGSDVGSMYPATPFDFGSGLVNALQATDPGLVFPSEYIGFICALPNVDPATIKDITGELCNRRFVYLSDLNLPSVTITALNGSRMVRRTVKNAGNRTETYLCSVFPPNGTVVQLSPTWFSIVPLGLQVLEIQLNVTQTLDDFSFGEVVLTGSLDHVVRIPLSVLPTLTS
ncbi:Subtilisin-like protease, fibronectin type-III domain [Dillenia turbinata]|uniref:Subtilisin-like protease, fibronectin type-III domain n=1 Tax=Dillenia turbinata TaxID=194707 RepID=A0AAN8ZCH3_9MAGN